MEQKVEGDGSGSVGGLLLLDPETEFLYSKEEKTGNEWEMFKENVKPLKRGRKIGLLNQALKSHHTHPHLKDSLLHTRMRLIEEINEYKGEDPLQPWIQCIKWVQEAFPPGGDGSGLVVIYEQCVRTFWHDERYKDDLRYLKIWLEYADNCLDAEVVYSFLEANGIGQKHSSFFISYALHMESKDKIRTANEIFNRGISRDAQPMEKLKDAFKKFLTRSMGRSKPRDEDSTENRLPSRSFGTVLARTNTESSDISRKKLKQDRAQGGSLLTIYKDTSSDVGFGTATEPMKPDTKSWHVLGARAERNKENNAIPSKWTSTKIPHKAGIRSGVATAAPCIEIFVDEECEQTHLGGGESGRSSATQLRHGDGQNLKRETELLRENPLRNFPVSSLPR